MKSGNPFETAYQKEFTRIGEDFLKIFNANLFKDVHRD